MKTFVYLSAIALFAIVSAQGATFNWDADAGIAGPQAGSGNWDTVIGNTSWLDGTTNVVWAAANSAVFAGTDGAANSYIITLAGGSSLNPSTIAFSNTGYMLTAGTATTLALQNTGNNLTISSGRQATIGSNVDVRFTGSASGANLTVSGGGTLQIGMADGTSTGASISTNSTNSTAGTNINIAGSTVNLNVGGSIFASSAGGGAGGSVVIGSTAATATLNVRGGTLTTVRTGTTVTTGNLVLGTVNNAVATMTIDSGYVSVASNASDGLRFGTTGTNPTTGTVNLNGGTLTTPAIIRQGTSTATFNFNGGTLKANKTTASFMAGLTRANVRNSGAIIDSNGFNITIAQTLLHSNIGGDNAVDGGLTKLGAGVLTLSGVNTYTGATTIQTGTLRLAATGSINNSTTIDVRSGAVYDVSAVTDFTLDSAQTLRGAGSVNGGMAVSGSLAPGDSGIGALATGSLVFNDASTLQLEIGASSGDSILSSGAVNLSDGGNIDLDLSLLADPIDSTIYTILEGTSITGTGLFRYAGISLVDQADFLVTSGSFSQMFEIDYGASGITLTAVPEPGAIGMTLWGLAVVTLRRFRRRVDESII